MTGASNAGGIAHCGAFIFLLINGFLTGPLLKEEHMLG